MSPDAVIWQTDDPCPVCGTGLVLTGDDSARSRQDCRRCGWSTTWDGGADG
jgi:ribosomal protein S27AE